MFQSRGFDLLLKLKVKNNKEAAILYYRTGVRSSAHEHAVSAN